VGLGMAARGEMEVQAEETIMTDRMIPQCPVAAVGEAGTRHRGVVITPMGVQAEVWCESRLGANCVWTAGLAQMEQEARLSIHGRVACQTCTFITLAEVVQVVRLRFMHIDFRGMVPLLLMAVTAAGLPVRVEELEAG